MGEAAEAAVTPYSQERVGPGVDRAEERAASDQVGAGSEATGAGVGVSDSGGWRRGGHRSRRRGGLLTSTCTLKVDKPLLSLGYSPAALAYNEK